MASSPERRGTMNKRSLLNRASRLEQDLAAARRDVEMQTALAAKAGAEAGEQKARW
jgi:hypothetical protein